jgi:hypothetical protein
MMVVLRDLIAHYPSTNPTIFWEIHGNAFHPQRILKISSAVYSNKDKLACVSVATASNDDVQDADFNASITGLIQAFNIYSQIIV